MTENEKSVCDTPPTTAQTASDRQEIEVLACNDKDTEISRFLQVYDDLFHQYKDDERFGDVPVKYKNPVIYLHENLRHSIRGIGEGDARPTENICNTLAEFILNWAVRIEHCGLFQWADGGIFVYRNSGKWEHGTINDLANIVGATARALLFGGAYLYGKAPNMIAQTIYKEMSLNEDYKYIAEEKDEATQVAEIPENCKPWELEADCLNPFAEASSLLFFGQIGGRNALCTNSLVVVKARQKSGKSYAILLIIRTLLTGVPFDTLTPLIKPRLVMVFDLEMAEVDLSKRYKPIYNSIGEEDWGRLQVYSLLCVPRTERLEYVRAKVAKYNPDIIVFDTITELTGTGDYNNATEAATLGEELKKLFAERLVFAVIHQNKGDENAKGAIGAIAENLCSESYKMIPDKGVFSLTLDFARFASNVDAEPLCFSISDGGEIMSSAAIAAENEARLKEGFIRNFEHLFADDEEIQYSELVSRIKNVEGLQDRAAQDKIKNAYKVGSLVKEKRKKYAYYRIADR